MTRRCSDKMKKLIGRFTTSHFKNGLLPIFESRGRSGGRPRFFILVMALGDTTIISASVVKDRATTLEQRGA